MLTENEPIDSVEMRDDGNLAHMYILQYVTMKQLNIYPSLPAQEQVTEIVCQVLSSKAWSHASLDVT